jgi:hypothetical protein
MNRCEYTAQNFNKPDAPVEKCGDPASVQIGRQWYCPRHGKLMMGPDIFAAEEREKRLRDVRGWLCTTYTAQLDATILAALRAKQDVTKVEIKPCPECDKKLAVMLAN